MSAPTDAVQGSPPSGGQALAVGTRLDDYEIEQVLARSSFAVVYRALDHALRVQVAIKEYLPEALAQRSGDAQVVLRRSLDGQAFERGLRAFVGEAQTLARCEHPSLLRIDRILQRNGTAYRVMRHSPGVTLREQRRAQGQAPDAPTLAAWFDALLGALEALHREGWVHGAVSPDNVLLLADGRPLLMDFGAVRAAVIGDRTHGVLASLEPSFEPIEQREPARKLAQGPWTDLYSLAATLRFSITGRAPRVGSVTDTASRPPAELLHGGAWARRHGAGALAAVLDACCREASGDRPQSVAQVREMLAQARPVAPSAQAAAAHTAAAGTGPAATALATPGAPTESAAVAGIEAQKDDERSEEEIAADAARAKVMADLEQTFVLLDVRGSSTARASSSTSASMPTAASAAMRAPTPPSPVAPTPVAAQPASPAPPAPTVPAPAAAPTAASASPARRRAAPRSPSPAAAAPTNSPPSTGRSRRLAGVTAVVAGVLLVGAWLLAGRPPASGDATRASLAESAAPPLAPSTAPTTPESPKQDATALPVVAEATVAAAPPAASAAPAPPPGPRAQCTKRSGYALYQCLQAQCAKRGFTKHPECERLRKTQSLD